VDVFAISTDVDRIYLDYKKPSQRALEFVTTSDLETHYRAGHFPPGNMGPKVESVLRFLRGGGREAIVTCYDLLHDAVTAHAGTHIVHHPQSRRDDSLAAEDGVREIRTKERATT
jgi:carbamate kinase